MIPKRLAVAVVLLVVFASLAAIGLRRFVVGQTPHPLTYLEFLDRDQDYYAQVAGGCNALIAEVRNRNGQELVIPWDDPRVAPVLRELRPQYLEIDSGRAFIMVGVGHRDAYAVIWEQHALNVWQLSTVVEGLERKVYSTNTGASMALPGTTRVMAP
jgi:hypothetical protein